MRFHCSSNLVWKPRLFIEWASARVPPTPIFGALQIFSICHLFWSVKSFGALACRVRGAKKPLEGFGWFEAWQTAGLNATKKLLMSPWRPRKSCWCGVGALACGVRGAKKAFGGFWRVLKGLKPGKRQAWTPVKSYWCRLERQEKAVDVALVPWPAGSGVPKKPLEGFGGFWRVWSLANGRLERQ